MLRLLPCFATMVLSFAPLLPGRVGGGRRHVWPERFWPQAIAR